MERAAEGEAREIRHGVLVSSVSRNGRLPRRDTQLLRRNLAVAGLIFSDLAVAAVVWLAASFIQGMWGENSLNQASLTALVPGTLAWVGLRTVAGLYPGYGLPATEELRRQTYAVIGAGAITIVFAFFLQTAGLLSRLFMVAGFLGLAVGAPLVRHLAKRWMMKARLWGKPVLILGAGEEGQRVARGLEEEWGMGLIPVVLFGGEESYEEGLSEAAEISHEQGFDSIIFATPEVGETDFLHLLNLASYSFRHVIVLSGLQRAANSAVAVKDFGGSFGVEIKHNLLDSRIRWTKRLLELATTAAGFLFLLPLLGILAALVWLESGGPIFYSDQRMGSRAKPFSCVKFRTMIPDAEKELRRILEEDPKLREEYLTYHKLRDDPRVTRVGSLLRRTSLDELPQLFNVLRGEMSLVGPRPYLPRESPEIGEAQGEILRVNPGITGLWQVSGRNLATFSDRVGMDLYYVRNWSIWLDLVILARTFRALFSGRDAH